MFQSIKCVTCLKNQRQPPDHLKHNVNLASLCPGTDETQVEPNFRSKYNWKIRTLVLQQRPIMKSVQLPAVVDISVTMTTNNKQH